MKPRNALAVAAPALSGAAVFHWMGDRLPGPPIGDPEQLGHWWEASGTTVAALSLVRLAGLVMCAYLALIAVLALVAAATRWRWACGITHALATPVLRRLLLSGGLAVALTAQAAPTAAATTAFTVTELGSAAAEVQLPTQHLRSGGMTASDLGAREANFSVTDIGSVMQPDTLLSVADIGPADERQTPSEAQTPGEVISGHRQGVDTLTRVATTGAHAAVVAAPESARASTGDDATTSLDPSGAIRGQVGGHQGTWVVTPGDNLWGIAAQTVAQRTGAMEPHSVLQYWLELIDVNANRLNGNPDLIFSGQVLLLPETSPAP